MKYIHKFLFLSAITALVLTSCNKIKDLPHYSNGTAVQLTSSKTSVVPTPADSANVIISFSWTSPKYATDTSTYKFILEIDSTGRNFSKEVTRVMSGKLNTSFTGQQINTILADFGFAPNQTVSLDLRITSSYGNNNERLFSNVVKISITPYLIPVTLVPSSTSPVVLQVNNASN
ncbi:MAG: SusE domain-containing protein, partial [Bacteroidota bacterium]|nr:SusE domain-containing protein [Bacteroidota bacterium]